MRPLFTLIAERLLIGLSLCYLVLLFIGQPAYACVEMEEDLMSSYEIIGWFSVVAMQVLAILGLAIKYFQSRCWLWVILSIGVSVLAHFVALGTMIGLDRMTKTETLSTPALLSIGFITIILTSILAYKLLLNLYKHQAPTKLALKPIPVS